MDNKWKNQELVSKIIRKWEARGQFVIPTFLKSIAFIATEVGELFDAWLRTTADDGFVRNSGEKKVDMGEELADVVFMCYVAADRIGVDLDQALREKLEEMGRTKYRAWDAALLFQEQEDRGS